MGPYRPFLVPLLSGSPYAGKPEPSEQAPGSPLEEENSLGGFQGRAEEVWEYLQHAVKETYGLPLLTQMARGYRETPPRGGLTVGMPNRYLMVDDSGTSWFLIEQPFSVGLIDQFSQENQIAAIARPSLFARLWREMEAAKTRERPDTARVEESPGNSAIALDTFLSGLLTQSHPSDWHLEPGRDHFLSRLRINGQLQCGEILTKARGNWLVNSLVSLAGLKEKPGMPMEGRLLHHLKSGQEFPLRISLIPSQHGPAMVVRFLYPQDNRQLNLDSIGLQENQRQAIHGRFNTGRGLWLVVGPTGSGKSTTLRAFLQLSTGKNEKVLTIEDPVEYTLQGAHHLSLDSPPGLTWARAVRAFLRQAPDCILIGEIRDEETASIALQAARTGHRILTTLHARDNPGVKRRFSDLGQNPDSLESVCECVLHQRLLPRLCPNCRHLEPVPEEWGAWASNIGLAEPRTMATADGCQLCNSGKKGRQAVFSSGNFSSTTDVAIELREAAWQSFLRHQISLADTMPYLPQVLRARFGICQP